MCHVYDLTCTDCIQIEFDHTRDASIYLKIFGSTRNLLGMFDVRPLLLRFLWRLLLN